MYPHWLFLIDTVQNVSLERALEQFLHHRRRARLHALRVSLRGIRPPRLLAASATHIRGSDRGCGRKTRLAATWRGLRPYGLTPKTPDHFSTARAMRPGDSSMSQTSLTGLLARTFGFPAFRAN